MSNKRKTIPIKECPMPPQVLLDKKQNKSYQLGEQLGEGGFARVFKVKSDKTFACKVICKLNLKSSKQKQKLLSEIKIHSSLQHINIVQFVHCFEDSENVYILLELCESKSLMEMLKKRKRLSEEESRYFMLQLLSGVAHMHRNKLIHRDLKLGNLFLTGNMQLKIGDFGLATHLKHDGERKKTICGTPNYIAPEVLFSDGHSFEVDMWSIGVILFTLVCGKPPFQTKDVKAIYKKIKENSYEFPDFFVTLECKNLIQSLLSTRPEQRPSIQEVFDHPFFRHFVPKVLPVSAFHTAPVFDVSKQMGRLSIEPKQIEQIPILPSQPQPILQSSVQRPRAPFAEVHSPRQPPLSPRPITTLSDRNIPVFNREPLQKFRQSAADVFQNLRHDSPREVIPRVDPFANIGKPNVFAQSTNTGSLMEMMFHTLSGILQSYHRGSVAISSGNYLLPPRVFISKWIDYSNKYGLGYQLTNGSVGVYFNDSTSIILSPDEE